MGKTDVQVRDVPEPKILNDRDAIVRITTSAICGSDLHLYNGFMPTMQRGDILGHEFMGEVVEVGRGVTNLDVGDRVVVPAPIACGRCWSCRQEMFSLCENSNPNAWLAEKALGYSAAGIYGYSHLTGGFAGGQAQYARVPFADVGPMKVPDDLSDEQVLFLGDVLSTGYMGAEMADINPADVVAVWGAGAVGQFAIKSAFLLGAERVIAIDRYPSRLRMAAEHSGAETLDYEDVDLLDTLKEMTGGRGPDACIDAVGMEGDSSGVQYAFDRALQATRLQPDRPIALRQAILACRNGGTVSVLGAYGGYINMFPMGAVMNRSLTLRSGQVHAHRYMRPLLERIQRGEIDPTFVITHRLPLDEAPRGYELMADKADDCVKVVLQAA
jgi:threonine dehydrogenase-like Zn-dependent dehydrogenase